MAVTETEPLAPLLLAPCLKAARRPSIKSLKLLTVVPSGLMPARSTGWQAQRMPWQFFHLCSLALGLPAIAVPQGAALHFSSARALERW